MNNPTVFKFNLTTKTEGMTNITQELLESIKRSGIQSGIAVIYCPHTTAAITINENADPDVTRDLNLALKTFFPPLSGYQHVEGNSPAHLKASLFGSSETIIIEQGRPVLGTWQSPYFCEFDGPRRRSFYVKILGS